MEYSAHNSTLERASIRVLVVYDQPISRLGERKISCTIFNPPETKNPLENRRVSDSLKFKIQSSV